METTSFRMWNNAAYEDHSSKENLQPLLLLHHNNNNNNNSPSPMDAEIEEIQHQITQLTSRLTSLRLQKTHWFSKPALPQPTPFDKIGKVKGTPPLVKNRKRSVSMGPSEIAKATGWSEKEEARRTRVSPGSLTRERKKGSVKVGSRYREKKGKEEEEVAMGVERRKRRWEIPRELVLHGSEEEEEEDDLGECMAILKEEEEEEEEIVVVLPRIRTSRCMFLSPRDSGAAKRVADLEGRTTFFSIPKHDCCCGDGDEDEDDGLVCQSLDFGEG